MTAILLEAPAAEPISLADAKAFLRVEHDDDDAVIASLIAAARAHIETRTRHCLLEQTWRVFAARWPGDGRFRLRLGPAREVGAARLRERDGGERPLDLQAFVVLTAENPGVVAFVPGTLAMPESQDSGIELDVRLGYGAAEDVPEPLRHAVRILVAHWYEIRLLQAVGATSRVPEGLDALITPYRGVAL